MGLRYYNLKPHTCLLVVHAPFVWIDLLQNGGWFEDVRIAIKYLLEQPPYSCLMPLFRMYTSYTFGLCYKRHFDYDKQQTFFQASFTHYLNLRRRECNGGPLLDLLHGKYVLSVHRCHMQLFCTPVKIPQSPTKVSPLATYVCFISQFPTTVSPLTTYAFSHIL